MTINEWMEDFDNEELPDYERRWQLRESVIEYNERNHTALNPDRMVSVYLRQKRQNIFRDE